MKCPYCSIIFEPKREWQKYCTPSCKEKARNQSRHETAALHAEIAQLRQQIKELEKQHGN